MSWILFKFPRTTSITSKSINMWHLQATQLKIIPFPKKNVFQLCFQEELLYKLYKFISLASAHVEDDETADFNNLDHLLSKMASSPQLSRYYIGTLKLTLNQIKLSVQKSNKLRQDLQVCTIYIWLGPDMMSWGPVN